MENLKKKYPKASEAIVKIFAVLGLAIIIMIAIYGALAALRSIPNVWQAIGNAFTSVTSIFDSEDKLILKSSPQTPTTGEAFEISWKMRGNEEGSFAFGYECVEGVNFEIIDKDDSRSFVFCNTPTNFETDNNKITVTATLLNESIVAVPVTISFTRKGERNVSSEGTIEVTIIKSNDGTEAETINRPRTDSDSSKENTGISPERPAPGAPTTPSQMPQSPSSVLIPGNGTRVLSGYADLSVRLLDTGVMNRVTGQYTPSPVVSSGDRVAIRFEVINIGTNSTGSWRFNATLPTDPSYIFPSSPQQSLNPGDRIQYTLGFDQIKKQTVNQITITADVDNIVRESDESNNTLIQSIYLNEMSGNNYSDQNFSCSLNSNGTYRCYSNGSLYNNCFQNGLGYSCYIENN